MTQRRSINRLHLINEPCMQYYFWMYLESFRAFGATPKHIQGVWHVMELARQKKISHGDRGWGTQPFTLDDIAEQIERGNTHLGTIDDHPAASLEITYNDTPIWGPDMGADGLAGYIHSVGAIDTYKGVGRVMLSWACQTIYEEGLMEARLDCNRSLEGYYQPQGFIALKLSPFVDYPTVLHRRPLADCLVANLVPEVSFELADVGSTAP